VGLRRAARCALPRCGATDFEKRGQGDDQLRDKETGERVWLVRLLDLDPEAGKFGAAKEFKVKVIAQQQPVPPTSTLQITLETYVHFWPRRERRRGVVGDVLRAAADKRGPR
jgi:hypothetical protein